MSTMRRVNKKVKDSKGNTLPLSEDDGGVSKFLEPNADLKIDSEIMDNDEYNIGKMS